MLALGRREEVESLTYHEVVLVLSEQERALQDQRTWDLSVAKSEKPVDTYNEIMDRIEEALDPGPDIDELPNRDWLRA